jgi:hypothetical protein
MLRRPLTSLSLARARVLSLCTPSSTKDDESYTNNQEASRNYETYLARLSGFPFLGSSFRSALDIVLRVEDFSLRCKRVESSFV